MKLQIFFIALFSTNMAFAQGVLSDPYRSGFNDGVEVMLKASSQISSVLSQNGVVASSLYATNIQENHPFGTDAKIFTFDVQTIVPWPANMPAQQHPPGAGKIENVGTLILHEDVEEGPDLTISFRAEFAKPPSAL